MRKCDAVRVQHIQPNDRFVREGTVWVSPMPNIMLEWLCGAPQGPYVRCMDRPTLRVRLLGTFELSQGDARIALDAPRVQSLVAYLALHRRGRHPRQRIAFLFWPDSTEKQAQTNLRNVLHQLRRAVPSIDGYLEVGSRALAWRDAAPIGSDVAEFEEGLDRADREHATAAEPALEAALAVYGGDLLPGCYDEWLLAEQDRLRQRYVSALERLLALHAQAGVHDKAIRVAERLLRFDPLREDAHRSLIVAHIGRGDRARALRAYHECAAVLERELGITPGRLTRDAYEAALGLDRSPPPVRGSTPAPSRGRRSMPARSLVGREREWNVLMRAWDATRTGGARLVLIAGEAGIGKTRLVEELAQWMAQQGHATATARSYAAEGSLAFGPAIEWLRSDPLRASVAELDDATQSDLASLLPEITSGRSALAVGPALGERERRQRIYHAVVRAVQGVRRPLVLVADDLQWCDRETLELLHYLVRRSASGAMPPLAVLGTVRREELDTNHPLHAIANGLIAAERLVTIELGRLDARDTATLAEQHVGRPLVAHEATALYRQTEGNPLFIIETLRTGWSAPPRNAEPAGHDAEGERTTVVSPKVQAIIESRLRQLSPEAMMLAGVAATIGREFTLDLLAGACDVEETSILQSLDELWRRRIIRARGIDGYDFSHDRIREVAYLDAGPLRRRAYHLRVARALEHLRGDDPSAAGQLAWHYDRGGAPERAIAWYARAADAALQLSALDAVARVLRRALDLLQRLPDSHERDEQELVVRLKLGAALVALQGYASGEMAETYRRARALCERLGRPVPPPILRALALVGIATSDLDATESFGAQLLAAGDADDLVAVEGHYVLGVAAFWRGRLHAARESFERAIARYRPERHREHVALYTQDPKVVCLSRLSWTLWLLGHPREAVKAREDAIELAHALGNPYSHAYALWFSLFIAIDADDRAGVREQVSALERVATEHGLVYIAAIVDSFVGYRETLDGEWDRGVARMEAALSDPRAAGQDSVLRPQTLLLLARAHASGGDSCRGLDAVNEALSIAAKGPNVWESELYRLRARLLIARGANERSIDAAFAQALATARAQGAAWVELCTAVDLTRWRTRSGTLEQRAESRRTLSRAREQLSGGLELATVREAARLIADGV